MQDRVLERLAGEAQGQIRIGAGEAAVLYLLPGILTRFQKLFPKVRIIIHHQRADETLRMLKAGELDLGVRSLVAVPSWAYFRPSLKYRRMAVSAKNHPFAQERAVTIESIARHPLLFPGTQSITRVIVEEKLTKRGLTYKVGLEAGGWEAIKTYAANGFGVAVVPELCLSPIDRRRLLVADASGLFGEDRYGVVVRSGTFAPKAVAKMITLLDPEFPENVLEKPKK
jgi:DNA-binding transcriptional LysR family regulator